MHNKEKIRKEVVGFLFMVLGCIAYGSSTSLFLAPNTIIAGGATGLAVLIAQLKEELTSFVGMISIAINLPILLLGLKYQGWRFIVRCLLTIVTLGVVTDLLVFLPPLTDDGILASLYGGVCQGVGIGLFVRYQFSSGGTELLGRVLTRWIKVLSIPVCVGILDGAIVILGAVVLREPANMLHALIVVFVSTKVSELVLTGLEKSKMCIIITDKGEEISKTLLESSPRGITMLEGEGMYTHNEHNVLLTCVKNNQLSHLKQVVKSIDEKAFIIINDSVEVRGKGFKSLNEESK